MKPYLYIQIETETCFSL